MFYCSLVGFLQSVLRGEEDEEEVSRFFFLIGIEGVCANCVAGKQQHDCPSVSPDTEALSWLSVPCTFLALTVRRAALFRSLDRTFPRSHKDATVQKSIIITM